MQMLLQPVVALAAWTLVMCIWMYVTRLPAMSAAGVQPDSLARDPDMSLDKALPVKTQWVAHNFNHLHEAPVVFYAVMLVLALLAGAEGGSGLETERVAIIGWAYVGLRVVHSLVQATVNKVVVRFGLFALSQIVLGALLILAAMAVFDIRI